MTRRIVREFRWSVWLFGRLAPDAEPTFHEETVTAEVACDGPYLDSHGHVDALSLLREVVQPWLDKNWEKRLILAGADPDFNVYCMRFSWGRKPFILPQGNDAAAMAQFLLTEVAAPGLLGKGLNVMHVTVRRANSNPYLAHYAAPHPGAKQKLMVQKLEPDQRLVQTPISYGPAMVGA